MLSLRALFRKYSRYLYVREICRFPSRAYLLCRYIPLLRVTSSVQQSSAALAHTGMNAFLPLRAVFLIPLDHLYYAVLQSFFGSYVWFRQCRCVLVPVTVAIHSHYPFICNRFGLAVCLSICDHTNNLRNTKKLQEKESERTLGVLMYPVIRVRYVSTCIEFIEMPRIFVLLIRR